MYYRGRAEMAFGAGLAGGNFADQGRNERRRNGFTLTKEQQIAKKFIQGALTQSTEYPKTAIILVGLSGIGKSTLFTYLTHDFNNADAVIHPITKSLSQRDTTPLLVTQGTPLELERFERNIPHDYHLIKHTMKGMQLDEMTQYVHKLLQTRTHRLPPEQIVHYTMGIPTLAIELAHMFIPAYLEEPEARKLAENHVTRYLHDNIPPLEKLSLPAVLQQYVDILPPQDVFTRFLLDRTEEVYDTVDLIMLKKAQQQEQGITIPIDPFFTAPESEAMYNKLYSLRNGSDPRIEIYIPHLNDTAYQQVIDAFGLDIEKTDDHSTELTRAFSKGNASSIFELFHITRKTEARLITPSGEAKTLAIPDTDVPGEHAMITNQYLSFTIPAQLPHGSSLVYFKNYNHRGFSSQTAYFGYMVESVLQQLGIFYIADNGLLGEQYCFDPQSNHILLIPA